VVVEVTQRVVLDGGGGEPELLPLLDLLDHVGALVPDGARRMREVATQLRVRERGPCRRRSVA
jgi:hypothetical protein